MDIVLVQPKSGMWDIMGVRIPMSLLTVAAVPHHLGYKIAFIDQRLDPHWKRNLQEAIQGGAKIVGITIMVGEQIQFTMDVAAYAKKVRPDVLVAVGGSWAKTAPEVCMDDNIDVVCNGEGDYILPELMECLRGTRTLDSIPGILYRENGQVRNTGFRTPIKDLDELPELPYHLVHVEDYMSLSFRKKVPSTSIVTSRGCGSACTFCLTAAKSERKWRGYSVERVLRELVFLHDNYGVRDIYFNDDNMAVDRRRFSAIVKAMAESGRDFNWGTSGIRADSVLKWSDEELRNLVRSGCKNLDIGAESGSDRILTLIKKGEPRETMQAANRKLAPYPIIIKYTFMGGFPTETIEEFRETLRFRRLLLAENPRAVAPVFFYTPFPRTELFAQALEHGLKPPANLAGWAKFNYATWYRNYPSWLSREMMLLVENASFISFLSERQMEYKFPNPLLRMLFRIYYPVARFRSQREYYGFMIEKAVANLIGGLNNKLIVFNRAQRAPWRRRRKGRTATAAAAAAAPPPLPDAPSRSPDAFVPESAVGADCAG